jgi:hypothetical protein
MRLLVRENDRPMPPNIDPAQIGGSFSQESDPSDGLTARLPGKVPPPCFPDPATLRGSAESRRSSRHRRA